MITDHVHPAVMEIPESFCIESNIGMFPMSAGQNRNLYDCMANGFALFATIKPSGRYKVRVAPTGHEGLKQYSFKGRAVTFDALLRQIAEELDSLYWDDVVASYEKDARYFQSKHGKLAYYCYNEHIDSIPVIFLHGGPGDSSSITRPRSMHLMHPVYAFDQLGCGLSDPIPDMSKWNHEDYFRELKEFIDGMEFKKVILIGASWGAGLALGYAEEYGCDKIECMVLPSPFVSAKKWEEDQMANLRTMPEEYVRDMTEILEGEWDAAKYRRVMSEYYSRFLFNRSCNREIAVAAGEQEQNDVFKAMWGKNDFRCTGAMKDLDLIPGMEKIDVPVLLMCGDRDEVTLDTMLEYQKLIKGSRLSIVPYAGHALSGEQPEVYTASVKAFLRELGH